MPLFHFGMCDASAAVAVGQDLFIVANDEDNTLRTYRNRVSGPPVQELRLNEFLQVDAKHPETDLEAAACVGSRVYWMTSHGRNKEGEFRESRHRFFATRIVSNGEGTSFPLAPEGRPYRNLLNDLVREPRLKPFKLAAASRLAPKNVGALNIEGLSATPEGGLLIGFRNPIPEGKALLVPLLNPETVIQGQSARFGDPILLDLDGLGIRDLVWHVDQYYLIAGAYDGKGGSHLYRWKGRGHKPELLGQAVFPQFNPEALVIYPKNPTEVQILSDDGTVKIGGENCKNLKDSYRKSFRSRWMPLGGN